MMSPLLLTAESPIADDDEYAFDRVNRQLGVHPRPAWLGRGVSPSFYPPKGSMTVHERNRCSPLPPGSLFTISELNHHLDRLTVIHRTVAVGDAIEVRGAIEHEARLDPARQYVG